MKTSALVAFIAPIVVIIPAAGVAQDLPPADLARVELDRSRSCVAPLLGLAELNASLEPLARHLDRLRALGQAVAFEDTSIVSTLSPSDSVEAAVRGWFAADQELARRFVAEGSDSLQARRKAGRDGIKTRLQAAARTVQDRAQARVDSAQEIRDASVLCQGAILVRSAVQEACAGLSGPLCAAAATPSPGGEYRFVESAEDLWDIEEFRPWSDPQSLHSSQDGTLAGARSGARTRRGNVVVEVTLAPMIRPRSQLNETQIQDFQANLDSLGFRFDHPDFVMAPVVEVRVNLPEPLGGETHYVLHFGGLDSLDVVWTAPAASGSPTDAVFRVAAAHLDRLKAGDPLSLTGFKVAEGDDTRGEPVFSIALTQVNETRAATALLDYMAGQLGEDLKTLVPPGGGA